MGADRVRAILLRCAVCIAGGTAAAAASPQTLQLAPAATELTLRAYALGMMPMDGAFARFRGRIDFDPATPGRCRVDLVAESASLSFAEPGVREEVLSPSFLDAAAFPTLIYRGTCAVGGLQGDLALHGETHPLTLALRGDGGRLVATGTLDRTDWGINGRPLMVGASVRIQVSVMLSEAARAFLPGLLAGPPP